jgi:hypothetical protein
MGESMSRIAGLFLALCGGAAVIAGGTAPAVSASPAARSAASTVQAAPARRPVAFDCQGDHQGQVRPGTVQLDCLSGNAFVRAPHWRYWSATAAKTATGSPAQMATLWVNTCKPDCAAGHYRKYRATLSFWRPRTIHGVKYFTRMRLRYTHTTARDYHYRWGTYPGATIPGWIGGPAGPAG